MDSLFASHTRTVDSVEDQRIAARMIEWDPRYAHLIEPEAACCPEGVSYLGNCQEWALYIGLGIE